MGERKVMCSKCKEKFLKRDLVYITKTKKVCKDCNKSLENEKNSYKELIKYICNGFNQEAPTGRQLKTIAKLKGLGYSYDTIQWIIYYVVAIEKKKLKDNNLDFIPYFYDKAKLHFAQYNKAKTSSTNTIASSISVTYKDSKKPNLSNTRFVDINSIE